MAELFLDIILFLLLFFLSAMSRKLQNLKLVNFKRFPSLELPLTSPCIVIMGANGSGKTQLLHALLLFFQALKLQFPQTQRASITSSLSQLVNWVNYHTLNHTAPVLLHPSFAESKGLQSLHSSGQGSNFDRHI